ncbi:MAG: hypothetical protein ACT4OV_03920 [Microthrixaceae bacterium]
MRHLTGSTPARVTWLLVPLAMGPALGAALDAHSRSVALTGATLAWGTWAGVLVAVLIPRTVSLTALRIAAPAALGAANWSAIASERGGWGFAGVTWAAVVAVAAFAPSTGEAFVNGSSYGDELRLPLRAPGALVVGPIELTWLVAVAGPLGTPLLVAARAWIPAVALGALGLPAAVIAVRALHGLARRWVVFVPAGLVLHDLHAMVDPVLFPRRAIRRLGPAAKDTSGRDLTMGAFGLALEIELGEAMEIAPRRTDGAVAVEPVERVLFSATRPAGVLRAAGARGIAVT